MTRMYKALQSERMAKIDMMESTVGEHKGQSAIMRQSVVDIQREKDCVIARKADAVTELRARFDALSDELRRMISTVIEQLQSKISDTFSGRAPPSDQSPSDAEYLSRLDEMAKSVSS